MERKAHQLEQTWDLDSLLATAREEGVRVAQPKLEWQHKWIRGKLCKE